MPDPILPNKFETVHPLPEDSNFASSEIPDIKKTSQPEIPEKKKSSGFLLKFLLIFLGIAAVGVIGYFGYKQFSGKVLKNKQVSLVYWGLFEPESVMQQVISDYEKEHPGVKITYTQQSLTQYRERLQERLSSETSPSKDGDSVSPEVPDIFRIHQSWVPMFNGLLSEVPDSVFSQTGFESTFYPSAGQSLKYQGKYVAIPLMVDGLALFCNVDLFNAEGLSLPANWSDFKIAAQKLTTRDSEGKIVTAGAALGVTNNVDHWSDILGLMLLQSKVDLKNPGFCSKGANGLDVCPGADALKFFTNFATSERVWSASLPTSTYSFAKGNLAMYFGPSWRVFDIESIKSRTQSNFQYKIINVPQLPTESGTGISWSSYWAETVSKKSPYQKEAWEFLSYLSSKEIMQKMYQTQSALRSFGEPFSRVDMADLLVKDNSFVSVYLSQAPYAKNWYLSSETKDNGINDKIIEYYKNAVNEVVQGGDPSSALQTAGKGAVQILGQYGVTN